MSPKARWKVHLSVACQVLPLSILVAVEARDMYYRARWDVVPLSPGQLAVGDVILLSNRWYTLPTWRQVFYSLSCKLLFKTTWDEVAVIISAMPTSDKTNSTTQIMYCDFDGVHTAPIDTFLHTRRPRGAAVRQLRRELQPVITSPSSSANTSTTNDNDDIPGLSVDIIGLFLQEVRKLKAQPWYIITASWRSKEETAYYEHMVQMYQQRCRIRSMLTRTHVSSQAVEAERGVLREMEQQRCRMEKQLTQSVSLSPSEASSQLWPFHLFSGSLVASLYATFGLLPRDLPAPTRYVPQDFTDEVPLCGTNVLTEPLVFFRT